MLTVVTHLWRQPGYRSQFGPEHVNALLRGVARHYPRPFRFVCRTDGSFPAEEFDPAVVLDRLGDEHLAGLENPSYRNGPSCYRRLRLFDPLTQNRLGITLGDPLVALDLDVLLVGDVSPLWDRPEPLVLWRDPLFVRDGVRYNGSMLLLRAGCYAGVWKRFHPATSPAAARRAGFRGSDQAWLSYVLGEGRPTWGREDGVYSFRLMTEERLHRRVYAQVLPDHSERLPANARIIVFHGRDDPWHARVLARYPWAREHYLGDLPTLTAAEVVD